MKTFLILLLGLVVMSCSKESETKYSTDPEKPFLIITENTTRQELIKIAADFKRENNITVDFSETEFSASGRIEHLILTVDCNDGLRGRAESTVKILKTKNSGFLRNYKKGAKQPLIVGAM